MSDELAYERLRQVTPLAAVVLAANPGPMTLDGTNTWLLRSPENDRCIVVDPGPRDEAHLQAVLAAAGTVETILLTHGHPDHSDGAKRLRELTGAPVRALDPAHRLGGEGLVEGDVVVAAGVEVRVWATPGHSADSLSFLIPADAAPAAVLTGDTILGRGTTVVAYPDGRLADYLGSLQRLQALGDTTVLTGHGPELQQAGEVATYYLKHREERLGQVRAAAETLGVRTSARAVVERVYADVDRVLWPAAELSVKAQLEYLHGELPWAVRLRRAIGLV
ncbi:MAG TPA: MBL fold metallo-hydrolase [Jatrophihabitans sp.]|jgi:glyoxylase-like metal-dependent hydrolase (beta-lactamase superfamily II)